MLAILSNIIRNITPWFFDHGIKIVAIVIVAHLIRKFAGIFIEKIIRKVIISDHFLTKEAERKQEDTLIRIFTVSLRILVWLLTLLMILQETGIAIGPILAAAGIAGIAFGFGGQYLFAILLAAFLSLWKISIVLEMWCVLTERADWLKTSVCE